MSALSFRASTPLIALAALLISDFARAQSAPPAPALPAPAPADAATPNAPTSPLAESPAPAAPSPETAPPKVQFAEAPAAPLPAATPPPATATRDEAPRTLLGSGAKLGGYGGFDVGYTRVAGKDAALLCGGGAFLIDRALSIGLAGCGIAARINAENYGNVTHEAGDRLEFAYGGLVLGYQFFPKQLYNLSLTALVGGGGVGIVNRRGVDWEDDDFDGHRHVKATDALFVAEPRLTGYLNLTRWARMGAFAGYRFVSGVNMKNLSAENLSGPVLGGTVQFGWF